MSDVFQAGAARAVITPPVGACLYGYRPDFASTGVHDELTLTALALRQGARQALLVTIEVGDIHTQLCAEMCALLERETGVPRTCILLSATHTHSAPNVSGMEGWGEIDRPYYKNILLPALVQAGKEAVCNLRQARIAYGTTHSGVGVNRRQIYPSGEVGLGQNPFGCYDPCMTVATFRGTDGNDILNLIHYSCHGTAAGLTTQITRDWSGVMIDRVEHETGTLTAFWNGTVGDTGPRLTNGETTGNIGYMEELGGAAAMDAMRAVQNRGGFHAGELQCFTDTVCLPYRQLPPIGEVREKLARFQDPDSLINIDRLTYKHYAEVLALLESDKAEHPTHFSFPFTAVSIGDAVFLPTPYELFSEIALRLRAYLPWPHVLCLSNTNGYEAYFPSQDQICRGGYEVACFRMGGLYNLVDDADQYLIDEIRRIVKEN